MKRSPAPETLCKRYFAPGTAVYRCVSTALVLACCACSATMDIPVERNRGRRIILVFGTDIV